jgi:DNA repair protein SbcC/Rad50
LDPSTLRSVMGALSSLQAQGRKVGVITHVEEMKGQIDVQIEVVRTGPGRSVVRVVG